MALTLGDNFSYQGAKPLDARLKYDTLANMKAVADATMYDGCMAYCVATDKTYQWKSTNTVDPDTGKWREFSSGGGGTDYTAGDGIVIENDEISIDPMPAEDMDDVIDELPTGGNIAVTGYMPLATIIQFYGETAPDFFLACDGATYNKADYPELANHLLSLTNNTPYIVDGDDTKFKVPDLRGEFIRGTGSNSHANQGNGAGVGEHQDGTEHANIGVNTTSSKTIWTDSNKTSPNSPSGIMPQKMDTTISGETTTEGMSLANNTFATEWSGSTGKTNYTSRPTNTSVLFCIAYKDIYSNPMNDYSRNEKIVGSYFNGKAVYQKTIEMTVSVDTNGTTKEVALDVSDLNIETVPRMDAIMANISALPQVMWTGSLAYITRLYYNASQQKLVLASNRLDDNGKLVRINLQYTKTTD